MISSPSDSPAPQEADPSLVLRADYRPPLYWIRRVDLALDLDLERTVVASRMLVERNATVPNGPLRLHGQDLELLHVLINGTSVAVRHEGGELVIDGAPEADFLLEIVTACAPEKNTALLGVFTAGGGLFTQCEAEGFRRITYFLDRPDVMAIYTVTLRADKRRFPVLLSNGNLTDSGDLEDGRHFTVWSDPFPKPSYLFALVAADLIVQERHIHSGGTDHLLQVWVSAADVGKTAYAMSCLEAVIAWDEARFGLPLDLERFMVVGVADCNVSAMENKGLNLFNINALLASPATSTDADFLRVQFILAHEYCHNWTGNRVTCRDWFQISLKEGLTVFRHQEFAMDMGGTPSARAVGRIQDVRQLRSQQFPEDSGAMAHPVRPDSYQQINNFYTMTIYAKGAEVVRMTQTLVGRAGFEAGMRLYFKRHDGTAATCDDFIRAVADANPDSPLATRLDAFMRWYSQAGTPHVTARGTHDPVARTYTLRLNQGTTATSGHAIKAPLVIPVTMGLLSRQGMSLPLRLRGELLAVGPERVLVLEQAEQDFVFEDIADAPVPSLLRGLSAPVVLDDGLSDADLLVQMGHDSDAFNRWEAGQRLALKRLLDAVRAGCPLVFDLPFVETMRAVLSHPGVDPAFKELALTLPGEGYIAEHLDVVDPQAIHVAVMAARRQLAAHLHDDWAAAFESTQVAGDYAPDPLPVGRRALANLALTMLVLDAQQTGDRTWPERALRRFEEASNMTDRLGGLSALVDAHDELAEPALASFHAMFKEDALVLDKWFAVQASAWESDGRVFDRVQALSRHPDFSLDSPNRARSLLSTLCNVNPAAFHRPDGAAYAFWAAQVQAIDSVNPQVSGRLARALEGWARLSEPCRGAAHATLVRLNGDTRLSINVREVIEQALASETESAARA